MSSCGVCLKAISAKQVKVQCTDCKKDFHCVCYKMSKADVDCIIQDNMPWRCKPCAESRRKSLRFDSDVQEGKLTLEDIMEKIVEMAEGQKLQECNFNRAYEALSEKMEDSKAILKEQGANLERCLQVIDDLRAQNVSLTKRVMELEQRVEDMEQYSRANAVEIQGVPQEKNEDVIRVVQEVGRALDMDISESMIDACHRLGRTRPNGPPPGIIVKFVRRLDKEELLKKRRVKRTLSTRHMNLPMDQPIYINEALSPARRRLLGEARRIRKEKGFKFLWVRGGKILLRKEESEPVIQVTCQADLCKLG